MSGSSMTRILICIACGCMAASRTSAQGNPPGTITTSASATGIHQLEAGLEGGGHVRWSGAAISGGVSRQMIPAFAVGLSLRHAAQDWRVDAPTAFGGSAPWRELRRSGVGLNLSLALSRTLLVGVSPLAEWACDTRASTGDALTYGAVVHAVKVVKPDRTLGGGVSIHRQFYSIKVSPFVLVNWKLNDRLRIANTVSAGPQGGSGVELRCTLSPDWELAAGGVAKSDRFRLAKPASGAGSVGETSSIPMFARLSRKLGPRFKTDLYAGAMANGRLRVKDADGDDIASAHYAIAPAVAATLSLRY